LGAGVTGGSDPRIDDPRLLDVEAMDA